MLFLTILTLACFLLSRQLYIQSLMSLYNNNADDEILFQQEEPWRQQQQQQSGKESTLYNNSKDNNILTFVQISDIHLSQFLHKGHVAHLISFINNELPLINPELVIVSGDIVDAKDKKKLTSQQYESEWLAYSGIIENIIKRRGGQFWFDTPGNHDCFNVLSSDNTQNYFQKYSSVKSDHYYRRVEKPFGNYSFIGINACPTFGTSRPYNFFGYYDTHDMDLLLKYSSNPANHTFVTSHYPTSCILFGKTSKGETFEYLSNKITLFLNGHLHKLFLNLGAKMFAHKDTGFLELELADMKTHATFRIVAVDNDMISFTDQELHIPVDSNVTVDLLSRIENSPTFKSDKSRSPIVLVTNPKPNKFLIPEREPKGTILSSREIRMLIYTPFKINSIRVYIDDKFYSDEYTYKGSSRPWDTFEFDDDDDDDDDGNDDYDDKKEPENYIPLYTVEWNPTVYNDKSTHSIKVDIIDEFENSVSTRHKFRVDDVKLEDINEVGLVSRWILQTSFPRILRDLFIACYLFIMFGFLLIPKLFTFIKKDEYPIWRKRITEKLHEIDAYSYNDSLPSRSPINVIKDDMYFVFYASFLRFCEMSTVSFVFYPIYTFGLYMICGPFFIGKLLPSAPTISQQYAGFFLVGVWFLDGEFIPLADTFLQGLHELLYAYMPLVVYMSFCLTPPHYLYVTQNPRLSLPIHNRWYVRLIVFVIVMYQYSCVFTPTIFYGVVSMVLSPMKGWFVLFGSFVIFRVWNGGFANVPQNDKIK